MSILYNYLNNLVAKPSLFIYYSHSSHRKLNAFNNQTFEATIQLLKQAWVPTTI